MAFSFVKNVGSNNPSASGGTALTVAATVPAAGVAAGDILTVNGGGVNTAGITATCADSKGNTYTLITSKSGGSRWGWMFLGVIATALVSGDSITITFSATLDRRAISVDQFTPSATTTPDGTPGATSGNTATPSAATTPASANRLVVGMETITGPNNDTFTEDTDTTGGAWTSLTASTGTGTTTANTVLRGAYKVASVSGIQTYNPALGTIRQWTDLVAAFVESTAAAAGPPLKRRCSSTRRTPAVAVFTR